MGQLKSKATVIHCWQERKAKSSFITKSPRNGRCHDSFWGQNQGPLLVVAGAHFWYNSGPRFAPLRRHKNRVFYGFFGCAGFLTDPVNVAFFSKSGSSLATLFFLA